MSYFPQIFLPCSSEWRWYQILTPYTWWPMGFLSQIPLMASLPWLFYAIIVINHTNTNKRCFAVPKLWAANILCYLLFGTQSIKDIPILWISSPIIRIRYRHICFDYLPRNKDIAVMFKLWLYCQFYYLFLCYFGK